MKQKILVLPKILYSNGEKDKYSIYKDNKNKSGVYRWNNLVTGESYIGSSANLTNRFRDYYKKNRKSGIYNAILEYGHSKFSLEILEYCSQDIIIEREQYYINLLKPEYNICKIAGSSIGYKHSEKVKKLLSDSIKGRKKGIEFSLNLSKMRRGIKYKSYVKSSKNIRVVKVNTKEKLSSRVQGISVKIFDRSNKLIDEFVSMTEAAKYLGVHRRTISRVFETGISYDDYIYKFEIKDNRIWVYNSNYKLINIFKNMKETGLHYNISLATLSRYVKSGKLYKNKYFHNIDNMKN